MQINMSIEALIQQVSFLFQNALSDILANACLWEDKARGKYSTTPLTMIPRFYQHAAY